MTAHTDTGPKSSGLQGLLERRGQELGVSAWQTVTQEAVNAFAEATGDRQWIHLDPERAAAGPFGRTIAHGYFTLSLAPKFMYELDLLGDAALAVNYGLEKVRFTAPVPVGSKVRMRVGLAEVAAIEGGARLEMDLTFECTEADKPVCVARSVALVYWDLPEG